MSNKYKDRDHVPTDVICARLNELADAVTKGRSAVAREFDMRIPAELDRDADLVLSEAARRLQSLSTFNPMETVPKDGTYILVKQTGVAEPSVTVCCFDSEWSPDGWWMCCDGKNPEIPLRGPEPDGWMHVPGSNPQGKTEQ